MLDFQLLEAVEAAGKSLVPDATSLPIAAETGLADESALASAASSADAA